jgi:hypothetical protein
MQQAWLLAGRMPDEAKEHGEAAAQTFSQLGRSVRGAVAVGVREKLHAVVNDQREQWNLLFLSQGHWRELEDGARRLEDELRSAEDFHPVRDDICSSVLAPVTGLHARTCEAIRAELPDDAKLALELGRCVDQGLRPAKVYRYLYRFSEGTLEPSGDPFEVGEVTNEQHGRPWEPEDHLANCSLKPGEVLPEDGWAEDVQCRWEELRIPELFPHRAVTPGTLSVRWGKSIMRPARA